MTNLASKIAATGPIRLLRKTLASIALDGLRPTIAKIRRFADREFQGAPSSQFDQPTGYVYHRDGQAKYIRAYAKHRSKTRGRALEELLHVAKGGSARIKR